MKLGFIVNPIAGMGGAVGLKGTDGDALKEAIKRGAKPVAPTIALRFLKKLAELCLDDIKEKVEIYTPKNVMGEDYLKSIAIPYKVLDIEIPRETTAEHTKKSVEIFRRLGVDIIVFVGGDGTARDIVSVIGSSIPILGIPSGVKMYSGVFSVSPEAAASLLCYYIRNEDVDLVDAEIADIDEDAFRRDELRVRLYYIAKTISKGSLLAPTKDVVLGDEEAKKGIARYFVESILNENTLYILGPGTTVKAIADELGVEKTVLGIDAILGRKLIGKDLWGSTLLDIVRSYPSRKLVLTPIGGQGFLIGRGNKQLTPEILQYFNKQDLIVVATPRKLSKLRYLIIDSGDPKIDRKFSGYHRVITGYREETIVKIIPAAEILR